MHRPHRFALPTLVLFGTTAFAVASDPSPDFAVVRAVLERNCLECHGGSHRESDLSFADAATFAHGGARGAVVDRERPAASRLLEVVSYSNPDLAMPPSGVLPEDDRRVLEEWVRAGAPWPEGEAGQLADPSAHPLEDGVQSLGAWWAYDPLVPADIPEVPDAAWNGHPVDALLRPRIDDAGLTPAPLAHPETLLRRATFGLTGLPPKPSEREAFLADVEARGFDEAWSTLLDGLFASPHYGEHQARRWLDLVRYAETNGYERDAKKRNVWRYRDWVVRAFDEDLPYDRFAMLQLAGDELVPPGASPKERADALIATGFHRLGVWDDEPADRAQAKADEIAGIVDTTGQVFMATTVGCARCHDHKADPITQREYFELTAQFAGVVGYSNDGTVDIADPPRAGMLSVAQQRDALGRIDDVLAAEAARLGLDLPDPNAEPIVLVRDARSEDGGASWRYRKGRVPAEWSTPGFDDSQWKEGPGGFGTRGTPGAIIGTEWSTKRIQLRTTFRLERLPAALRLTLHHDEDCVVHLNGQRVHARDGYRGDYDTVQLDEAALSALVVGRNVVAVECVQTGGGQYIDLGLDTTFDPTTSSGVRVALTRALKERGDDPELGAVRALLTERAELLEQPVAEPYAAQVVYERGPEPPTQHVHMRGSVHAPGDEVQPAVPAAWSLGSASAPTEAQPRERTSGRRRAFAEWLFDGGAHLAARVEANRAWQALFGRGLCRTPGDFGRLGELPTHPELLDFLAAQLIDRGWSRKSLLRFLMESRAYRTASVPDEATLAADPRNDLFARFEPRRLTAEEFRDAALFVSGELNLERFGPSVFPPLPREVLATASRPGAAWGRSSPADAARRSLYVHTKRSLREPLLAALDQPDPDLPCPDRFPTNVPTQALLTLNGDFTNQRASAFAEFVRGSATGRFERLALAIERAFGRVATEAELQRAARFVVLLEEQHGASTDRALELFLLGLLNRNEFIWLD